MRGWVLEKALFLACRWLSLCTLEWQWGVGGPSLVLRTRILLDQGPTLMNSFNINDLPRGPSPNTATLGVRASI